MHAFISLLARDDDRSSLTNSTMATVLIVLLVLILVTLVTIGGLVYMRYRKRSRREDELPLHNAKASSTHSNHRRLAIRPTESIIVYQEKQNLLANSDAPPTSPVPEIRITFPEEVDEVGKKQSGRVVVVHVSESGVGLEPVVEEKLPAYQQSEFDRFQSLDLDRIGGLQEKTFETRFR